MSMFGFGKLSHHELLKLAKDTCIPPLLSHFHKGQIGGRVVVIGGCEEYTGAPFFSANASSLFGCDLVHIMCELNAALAIKSYSPNIMVHPYLRDTLSISNGHPLEMPKIEALIDRMHVVVLGPGLGRDKIILETALSILEYILTRHCGSIPVIIDADGLVLISTSPYGERMMEVMEKFPPGRMIITPNAVEFERICKSLNVSHALEISKKLHCITLQKGVSDSICFKDVEIINTCEGSNKRVGGQGDTLTGIIATMLSYSRSIYDFKHYQALKKMDWPSMAVLSCYVGSTVTRECSREAFKAYGRSMQTTNLNDQVGFVYRKLFE